MLCVHKLSCHGCVCVRQCALQVKRACAATYLYKTSGTCINLRVARSSQGPQAIAENIYAALVQAVEHIPKKWGNIQVRCVLSARLMSLCACLVVLRGASSPCRFPCASTACICLSAYVWLLPCSADRCLTYAPSMQCV